MAKKKTIKFKGIEFEEVSRAEYAADAYDGDGIWIQIDSETYYMLPKKKNKPKRKTCSRCGQAVK